MAKKKFEFVVAPKRTIYGKNHEQFKKLLLRAALGS